MVKCPECEANADLTRDGAWAHCASCTFAFFSPLQTAKWKIWSFFVFAKTIAKVIQFSSQAKKGATIAAGAADLAIRKKRKRAKVVVRVKMMGRGISNGVLRGERGLLAYAGDRREDGGESGCGEVRRVCVSPPPISQIYLLSSEISFFKIRKKYLQREEREINISKNKHFIIYSYKKMQNPNIVLYAPHTAKIEDKPIPTLSSPHDVVIRINYIGVCGSDVFPPPFLPSLSYLLSLHPPSTIPL